MIQSSLANALGALVYAILYGVFGAVVFIIGFAVFARWLLGKER